MFFVEFISLKHYLLWLKSKILKIWNPDNKELMWSFYKISFPNTLFKVIIKVESNLKKTKSQTIMKLQKENIWY